ncbi:cyclic nucleotide-binding domain-containing protein [Aeromicrobium sp. CTD01-1L150]|uniref:cyclic nucleotide-binding domain-containing protein n=1 Tax=Aeromicrobium sp. CTD01-1L150 TaxID=3341830 RepID=UPI0035BF6372
MAFKSDKVDKELVRRLVELTGLGERDATTLARAGQDVRVPEGWSIIFETTPSDKAYILLEGTVDIRKGGEKIAEVGPGGVLGEIGLLNHQLRSASVVAATPIVAIHFTAEAISDLVRDVPAFSDLFKDAAQSHTND